MKRYADFAALLASELHRYLLLNPQQSRKIPRNSLVVFQVAKDNAFNQWSRRLALRNRQAGQAMIYVSVKGWRREPALDVVEIGPTAA